MPGRRGVRAVNKRKGGKPPLRISFCSCHLGEAGEDSRRIVVLLDRADRRPVS